MRRGNLPLTAITRVEATPHPKFCLPPGLQKGTPLGISCCFVLALNTKYGISLPHVVK
jgi:hypothetical protein